MLYCQLPDVDECKGSDHGCEQKCENSVGSFECVCLDGSNQPQDGSCPKGKACYIQRIKVFLRLTSIN